MINYYELLGINPSIEEEKLLKLIDDSILNIKNNKNNTEKRVYEIAAIVFLKRFKKTLENYGGKANYDIALRKSKKLTKTINIVPFKKLDSKSKYKLFLMPLSLFAVFAIGASHTGNDIGTTLIEVPTYGETVETICEELGISPYEISLSNILTLNDQYLTVNVMERTKDHNAQLNAIENKFDEFKEERKDNSYNYVIGMEKDIEDICTKLNIDVDDVINLNENINIYDLKKGDVIRVPYSSEIKRVNTR